MSDHIKRNILLTGSTGSLGSHLMNSLLKNGYNLIIPGRGKKAETLEQRIYKLLKWFGISDYSNRLKIIEADYSKPLLGLSPALFKVTCSLTDSVIHCASDTCFSESKRDKVLQFNVDQLSGILELASAAQVKSFSYISTAYAAGLNGQICKEQLSSAKEFVNAYEESKALAEKVITDHCKRYSIPLTIIRPTIVYGDSFTGRTLRFNAFYYPIRSLLNIRDIYLNDIRNHGAQKSAKQGIYLDKDGYLFLPLHFFLPKKGSINLIPVNYFVEVTQKIFERPGNGGIFHVCNGNPPNLDQLSDYIKDFLKIKGIEIIYGEPLNTGLLNPVEELFERFIEPYRPYLSDDRIFDKTNTDFIAGEIQAPEMSYQIFSRCMNYGIDVNWGDNIFKYGN